MNQDMDREKKVRKKYIELFVETLYGRFSYLFSEKLEVVKQKAIDEFLDSDLTYDQITERMVNLIEERREKERQNKEEIKKNENVVIKSNSELNSMMIESSSVKASEIDKPMEIEKPKVLVKENNNISSTSNNKGAISLFNIVLSMLAIGAFVLIALILNLLLK